MERDADTRTPTPARRRAPADVAADAMTAEELAFVQAVDDYKRKNDRPFPTLREILTILKSLGYTLNP